jgi:predicted small integral membrane protein
MILRFAKALLVLAVALFYTSVVFNNLTDYGSNYQFVRHVLMMDSTLAENHGLWRAINSPVWHTLFYVAIIAWEILTMILCWWGGFRMFRAFDCSPASARGAHAVAIAGLTSGLLMWLVAFLTVGGEWFLMWQSKAWNAQETAFRMFTVLGIVLLLVVQPDSDDAP